MPDNVPLDSSLDTQQSAADLESLIREAEGQAALPVVDHPKPCPHTFDQSTHLKCPTCLWSFCTLCASSLDPRYCHLCLTEQDAALVEAPLVDTEGMTHDGRVLTPSPQSTFFQPRFGTLAKTISEMSDNELHDYVNQYKDLVRQAERALDFRRVVLGASQLEQSQRGDAQRRKLAAVKMTPAARTVSLNKSTRKQAKPQASLADMAKAIALIMENRKKGVSDEKR